MWHDTPVQPCWPYSVSSRDTALKELSKDPEAAFGPALGQVGSAAGMGQGRNGAGMEQGHWGPGVEQEGERRKAHLEVPQLGQRVCV